MEKLPLSNKPSNTCTDGVTKTHGVLTFLQLREISFTFLKTCISLSISRLRNLQV